MSKEPFRWVMTAVNEPFVREEFNPFPPGDGEVVVEVAGCGVCHTDIGFLYGSVQTKHALPLTLGHEISGRVVAVGNNVSKDLVGQAVLLPAAFRCGECDPCKRGREALCFNEKMPGNDIDGGFASHVKVPAYGLVPVDEALLAKQRLSLTAISVVADAVTTPYQAVSQSGLGNGDLAIINGVGGVGGYCVQMAKAFGAKTVAIDIDPVKLDMIGKIGADLVINASDVSPRDQKKMIAAFAKEQGLRPIEWFVFECSGTAIGQKNSYGLMVRGSTISIVGFTMDKVEVRLSNLMALNARALGNWGCLMANYPPTLDLVLAGKIQVEPFVKELPLDSINDVFKAVHNREIAERVVLVP